MKEPLPNEEPSSFTSYSVRATVPGGGRARAMFTSRSPSLVLKVADLLKKEGFDLEIYWCNFQSSVVPGEQGQLTLPELMQHASKEQPNGTRP